MSLLEKERLDKLQKARTPSEVYNLYREDFGKEITIVDTLDPEEKMELLIDAIETNKAVKGIKLGVGTNI